MPNTKAVIIDGYVDEPACFGVPPYISPYIRYIAGALRESGFSENDIHYSTIDSIRSHPENIGNIIKRAQLVIIVAGMTVPGKYLRSTPINLREIESIFNASSGLKILGGPIRLGFSLEGGKKAETDLLDTADVSISRKDIEAFVYDVLGEKTKNPENCEHRFRTVEEIGRWAIKGAFIIKQHPDYPNVMCELETYRGCGRNQHCSFCTEPSYGSSDYRPVSDVISEVAELYEIGARFYRIGRQPDILSYHAKDKGGDIPEPDPQAILSLYKGIRNIAPQLKVLHMDNANPGTIAKYPDLCKEIFRTIVQYHTPGDVAALGMESADPGVVKANGLKAMPDEVFEAIRIINEIGRTRGNNGMPEMLPGINLVHGLMGESKKTFDLNYNFLKHVLDSDLLLRRINIRQVMAFPDTPMYGNDELVRKHKQIFLKYKEKIRKDIDFPMLQKVVPVGTILRDVKCEINDRKMSFGRQMGSYPLLTGIPACLPTGRFMDIIVTRHGHRSITGVPYPLKINTAPLQLIQELPGIGKKQAINIQRKAPFSSKDDFIKRTGNEGIIPYLDF
ncbi:radical SAM protein [Methanolobus sp.]|jgi:radical SAM superfamily enzyme with C-terminal helix-hairpin-helix motif|uniref:radical SAM protein n=1 Tax=Methanolobus sp. TaxID=1874737 RepID=UPI0025F1AABA|nr:radical SAM protein [Methanolobus sp.]